MARIPTLQGGILPTTPQAPAAGLDVTVARASAGLGARIDALTERANRREDGRAVTAATTAGGLAGDKDPGAQMEGGGDLYREAFNRQATETGLRRLQIQSRDQLDQLARDHEADPEGFAGKAAAYRDGIASGLPDNMRAAWLGGFDTQAQPFVNQARNNLRRNTADQAVASFNELLPRRTAAIERLSGQAATGDADAAKALEQEQAGLANDLARLGPAHAFELGGRRYEADPTRTGARSVAQLGEMMSHVREQSRDAATLAAWRAAGSREDWINQWAADRTGQPGARSSAAAGASGGSMEDRIFRAENPAGDARRNAMGSSASGPGQITDPTWAAWAPKLGLTQAQRNDPAAHRAIFRAYQADAAQQIGRPLSDGEQYAAWLLGTAGLKSFLSHGRDADARTAYLAAAGPKITAEAFSKNPGLLEPGMTVGQSLDAIAKRVGATPGAGPAPAPPAEGEALTYDQARRTERLLRSELASDQRALRERQQTVRAELDPQMRENAAAIAETGKPVHNITDAQLSSAGLDPAAITRYRAQERAGQYGFQAGQELRGADTPEKVQAIADRFAPGGDLFAADPALASRILDRARARGVEVRGAALKDRLADMTAEAQATGEAKTITREEGAAAGLKPEEVDRINTDVGKAAELGRITREGLTQNPAERAATRARLTVEGERAAENQAQLQAYERSWAAQERGIKEDPAGFSLTGSKPAQELARRIGSGDMEALPQLVTVLDAEQQRMGVAPADRRTLPKPMADALTAQIMQGATPADRVNATRALLDRIPDGPARRQVLDAMGESGLPEGVRLAAGAMPRIGATRAARLAGELDTEGKQLNVTPALRKEATTQADAVFSADAGWFGGSDGLGTLRAAQYRATGQAAFLTSAEQARDRLVRVALVRGAGAPGGTPSRSDVQGAYEDLYGGVQVIQRPGVMIAAPKTANADELVRGLTAVRDRELQRIFPGDTPGARQARETAGRGTWVDAGNGFVFYPPNTGSPLPSADGRAFVVTAEDAAATPTARTAATPTPSTQPHDWLRRQQRAARGRLDDDRPAEPTDSPAPASPGPGAPAETTSPAAGAAPTNQPRDWDFSSFTARQRRLWEARQQQR